MDRRGNGHSSIKTHQGDVTEGYRTAGTWDLRKELCTSRRSSDVVFTTLHILPRTEREQWRSTAGMLPNLLTGQQTQGKVLAKVQKVSCNESEDNKERIPIVFIDPGVLVLY